jgi:hypothetical protein
MLLVLLEQFQIIKLLPLNNLILDLIVTNLLIINLLTLVFFIIILSNFYIVIKNQMLGILLFLKNQLLGQQRIIIFIIFLYFISCGFLCPEHPMLQGVDEYLDTLEEHGIEYPRRKVPIVWGVREYVGCIIGMASLFTGFFFLGYYLLIFLRDLRTPWNVVTQEMFDSMRYPIRFTDRKLFNTLGIAMYAIIAVPIDNWCHEAMKRNALEKKIAAMEKKAELAPPEVLEFSDKLYKSNYMEMYDGYISPEAAVNFNLAAIGVCVVLCFLCCFVLCIKKGPENSGFSDFTENNSDEFLMFFHNFLKDFFVINWVLGFFFFCLVLNLFARFPWPKVLSSAQIKRAKPTYFRFFVLLVIAGVAISVLAGYTY